MVSYIERFTSQLSHPDESLLNTRVDASHHSAWTLLTLLLPGAAVVLQGEELALPFLPLDSLPPFVKQMVRHSRSHKQVVMLSL